uniref:tRNA wybutosine-synthesizing protein 5-like n=1 Tax=Phallusia mammillata TaxID=59560 RepID=A0A6F9DWJ2_9ASCI|nr:tRNA wybutosine-synthesizing protein 5-like [Phallusia mammillata]
MCACNPVEIRYNVDKELFASSKLHQPFVLKGYDIGPCVEKWSVKYLCSEGADKVATAHVSESPNMNFIDKNFSYKKMKFSTLVQRASEQVHEEYFTTPTEYYYFRSLGEDVRKKASNINEQFPALSNDINFPDLITDGHFFSSVLRIASAGMQLWTHYDVMDNFLIQVSGQKRVVLFPPTDALFLYLKGDKSEIVDIDNPDLNKYPLFAKATKFQCILQPGDVLFIPALWFHNVVSLEFGIAVNVFWRELDESYYDAKDVYGNKDLVPAARSMDIVNRALKVLDALPGPYKDFYARKIIAHIEDKALAK